MKYRAEIDGLRALAVLPVILFHAGFELFSGGFVGVDVFFVISGYLITTILIEDIENKRFSIVNFYERRARRILPALFFVMLVCIPFAWMWMLPSQMKDFSQSLVAVSLFASNILFWWESGYFEAAAEEKPLLHTWSLAVEEQYYLLFPIFLIFAWRFGKNRVFWMIVILATFSLLLSEWGWRRYPTGNFYLAPTRAWELFAGSIAAFIVKKRGVQNSGALALLGLAAIVFSIFSYDETTPFPSVYALVPVLGVVLLLMHAGQQTIVARLLSTRAFVGIGLISYSLYLWHQPLFAFARIKLSDNPPTELMALFCLVAIGLAMVTWKYIETPFRQQSEFSRKTVLFLSLLGVCCFLIAGYSGHMNGGYRDRFDIPSSVYSSIERYEREDACFDRFMGGRIKNWFCHIGNNTADPVYFIFGDSHSLSLLPAFDNALTQLGRGGVFVGLSSCIPFLSVYSLRDDNINNNCYKLNQRVFDFVSASNVKRIVLVSRWSYYTDGGYNGDDFSYIGKNSTDIKSANISRAAFENGLTQTIAAYDKIGVEVVIVPQVPQQSDEPLNIYAKSSGQIDKLLDSSINVSEHLKLQRFANSLFNRDNVALYDFTKVLCDARRCPVGNSTHSFYFDDDHLSLKGSHLLIPKLVEYLKN